MRGVRIDLSDAAQKDRVYTSEDHLARPIQALDEISNALPLFKSGSNSCFGSGIFWQQSGHAFSASQCVFGNWSGLSVNTGSTTFQFTALDPSSFAFAIASARDELNRARKQAFRVRDRVRLPYGRGSESTDEVYSQIRKQAL